MRGGLKILGAAAVVLVLAGAADATSVTAIFTTVCPYVNVHVESQLWTGDAAAGVMQFTQVNGPDGHTWDGLPPRFQGFCIDLHDDVNYNQTYTWQVVNPENAPVPGPNGHSMTAAQHLELQELFGLYYTSPSKTPDKVTNIFGNSIDAAAFQAAIWEIVWEQPSNSWDLSSGALQLSNYPVSGGKPDHNWVASSKANIMLAAVENWKGDVSTLPELVALVSEQDQDQIVFLPWGTAPPPQDTVPEPLTMAGLGLGICSVVTYVRRRRAA